MVKLLTFNEYQSVGDISINVLVNPVRIIELTLRHQNKIIEDVSEKALMLSGTLVHNAFAHAARILFPQADVEKRLMIRVEGWDISGTPDLVCPEESGMPFWELFDWKFCSTYEAKNEVKAERQAQVNCYVYMVEKTGKQVSHAYIGGLFRDWSLTKMKSKSEWNYPAAPAKDIEVDLWPKDATYDYIFDRVIAHQEAAEAHEDDLPECTPEEMWEQKPVYSVIKKKAKRATRNLPTYGEAALYIDNLTAKKGAKEGAKYEIKFKKGSRRRCEDYCSVSKFCEQYQQYKKTKG